MIRNLQKISSPCFRTIPHCFGFGSTAPIHPETQTPSKPSSEKKKWFDKLPKHKIIVNPGEETPHMMHPIFRLEDIEKIGQNHHPIETLSDRFAYILIQIFRKCFDVFSRYDPMNMTEEKYLFRFILLETVAGLPGKNPLNIYCLIYF